MTAFLLTWKESGWPYANIRRMVKRYEEQGYVDEPWRLFAHKMAKPGDRAWVLRQGKGPKGIFGAGQIIGPAAPGLAGNGKTQMMAPVRFSAFVDPESTLLIHENAVTSILRSNQIHARASGYPLDDSQSTAFEELLAVNTPNVAARLQSQLKGNAIEDIQKILTDSTISDKTTRTALVEARLGQGRFRTSLIDRWRGSCAVTGCSLLDVLRASHIKPWRLSTNDERLDPANGILLSANMDALFDAGLVSFDDSGKMLVSHFISPDDRHRLGLPQNLVRPPDDKERSYLTYHRECFRFSSH